jgi:energy-coupling factor transporter ATP-binding protein EcfA2
MTEGQGATAATARGPGASARGGLVAHAPPGGALPENGPLPENGALPGTGPLPEPGPSPENGPLPNNGALPETGPIPEPGPSPENGPTPDNDPIPEQRPLPENRLATADGALVRAEPEIEPHVRVDARLLESAILALRKPIVAASLPLEAPGMAQARQERHKLLSQIDDYLLPRLRESGSPLLVALVGSTGAGKSTLVNSIVGAHVSVTGIRRPTTNSPVLACHPDDVGWFAENVFLPTVPRVRQEGLARSGKDGLLVLAANPGMPKGLALLDTPDIDSVVRAHHEFAHHFLDASDLWLFMTTASRYADAMVWEILQHARDRGAAAGIVLSRVLPAAAPEVARHFHAMLDANGLGGHQRFLIPETVLEDGKLPPGICAPIRDWLAETAEQPDRRVAVLTRTMSGVLDTFLARVPALAARVDEQIGLCAELAHAVSAAYQAGLDEIDRTLQDGSLMSGEVLARWQEFAGAGDLLDSLQSRRAARQRRHQVPARAQALNLAARDAIMSLITSIADRSAEECLARWRGHPAGTALLDGLGPGGGTTGWQGPEYAAGAGLSFGWEPSARGTTPGGSEPPDRAAALGRSSPDLAARVARAVSGWQDQVTRLVQAENVTKRSIARAVSLDTVALATVLIVSMLGSSDDEAGTAAIPRRLLTSLFGAGPLRDITARAQADLRHRITLILDEEMRRFADVINFVATPDAAASLNLYRATYALEVLR